MSHTLFLLFPVHLWREWFSSEMTIEETLLTDYLTYPLTILDALLYLEISPKTPNELTILIVGASSLYELLPIDGTDIIQEMRQVTAVLR